MAGVKPVAIPASTSHDRNHVQRELVAAPATTTTTNREAPRMTTPDDHPADHPPKGGQPRRFRRRPTELEAIQWTGHNQAAITQFGATIVTNRHGALWLFVAANQAWLNLEHGEWIAKDFLGYYPIKDEAMRRNYDEVFTTDPAVDAARAQVDAAQAQAAHRIRNLYQARRPPRLGETPAPAPPRRMGISAKAEDPTAPPTTYHPDTPC